MLKNSFAMAEYTEAIATLDVTASAIILDSKDQSSVARCSQNTPINVFISWDAKKLLAMAEYVEAIATLDVIASAIILGSVPNFWGSIKVRA